MRGTKISKFHLSKKGHVTKYIQLVKYIQKNLIFETGVCYRYKASSVEKQYNLALLLKLCMCVFFFIIQ